jgi:hypothetical protein
VVFGSGAAFVARDRKGQDTLGAFLKMGSSLLYLWAFFRWEF